VERFAIRVPTVDDLLDPYSVEPLEKRPLTDEVRDRIFDAWIDTREERPKRLTVVLPKELERPGLADELDSAIRRDLRETADDAGKLGIYSRSNLRQAQIAFVFLVVCLFISNLVDQAAGDQGFFDSVAQGLVVLGWVAMWGPANTLFRALTRRVSHKRYRELAEVPIEVAWD
jgi:hypothetical protein